MPPPTISWSTLPTRLASSSSLVLTLLPATMASSGGRCVQRLRQRVQLGHQQRAAGGDRGEADDTVGGRLRAVRGAEGIHHEHIAQGGILLRKGFIVLALADVHAAVFQQHQLARLHVDTVDPVTHQRNLPAKQRGQPLRDRRQRVGLAPHAFLRAPQVRGDHHRRALLQRALERRQRSGDALFGGDAAILDRHVQILADQHALAGEVEVGHADDGHGQLFGSGTGCRSTADDHCIGCGWWRGRCLRQAEAQSDSDSKALALRVAGWPGWCGLAGTP